MLPLPSPVHMNWNDIAVQAVRDHYALQKPGELADLLTLAADHKVRSVLEIGSDAGGTLWAWHQLGAEVISVSLANGPFSTGRPLATPAASPDRPVCDIEGDSHRLRTWLQLGGWLGGRTVDMLFVDGDHTWAGVEADIMAYTRFVRPGGLVVLHDICPHGRRPDVGVDEVWHELLGEPDGTVEIVHEPKTRGGIGVWFLPDPGG